jgi:hypothetical protein
MFRVPFVDRFDVIGKLDTVKLDLFFTWIVLSQGIPLSGEF